MSNSGGTLTLPSPTHPHHVDVSANLRSLRRSLSRSPSKFPLVRTASQSSSDAGSSPSSPSIRRVQSQFFGQNNSIHSPSGTQPHTQSPLATPFRPSVKLSLRSAKATKSPASSTSNKPFSRHRTSPRTSPKSPTRRVLTQASSSGNSIPSSNSSSSIESLPSGQENLNIFRTRSPAAPRKASEKAANRHSMHLDMSGSSQLGTSRFADASNGSASSMASPLKRSDASMSLDQSLGSPKAKRRSYGPSSLGADFNIFDHGPTSPGSGSVFDDSSREYDWTSSSTTNVAEPLTSLSTSAAMRRAGSLRKSTLQQRERTSWGKRYAAQQLSQNFGEVTTPKQRERTSWNRRQAAQQLATIPNETATPNAKSRPRLSLDQFVPPPPRDSPFNTQGPLPNPSAHTMVNQPAHQPHPLSRTMTTASTSTVADESPTQFPTPTVEKAKGPTNFSKSLPVGAVRPQAERPGQGAVSVSTPNYKNEKPFEGAFHSTGLISKMRYNPELGNVGGSHAVVPDTPCKGRRGTFATYPQPWSGGAKSRGRHIRHTFGVPSTPFDAQTPNRTANLFSEQPRPVAFGGFSNHSRKGSLLSLYSDDGRSPSQKHGEFEPTGDAYMPPTPTKTQPLFPGSSRKMQFSNGSPIFNRCLPAPLSAIRTDSIPQQELPTSSSPLERLEFAEKAPERASPHTPQSSMVPLDASRLSISNHADGLLFPGTGSRNSAIPPATPTSRHGNAPVFLERRAITPINGMAAQELDENLMSRFGKVESIGKGEFSMVYKVTETAQPARTLQNGFFSTPTHRSPSSSQSKVYAVKKLTLPIQGQKDRASRLREVFVLERLRGCSHILQLVNDWEDNNCLYIQTEYCEEGSLDKFLNYVGVRGRLDDFRIWKIMLEIAQGLRHIHSAGFIHLDLKPANIFINFEGVLKIGDFGLATPTPLERAPDLEGDREYLSPEALRGEIGQPADIFSLGLIMMEIAANVKLPENGVTWTALREGDYSEVPTLTQESNTIVRDATGMPIDDSERSVNLYGDDQPDRYKFQARHNGDIFGLGRKSELQQPPDFMKDPSHDHSLDTIVKSMLHPDPYSRPTVFHLLYYEATTWVETRRRAAATVFEGNWGPGDVIMEPMSLDIQMIDV